MFVDHLFSCEWSTVDLKWNESKLLWNDQDKILNIINGSDRPTDNTFPYIFMNSWSKSLCSMKHKLLLCELMKTHGIVSSVDRSEPLKWKWTEFILS